MSLAPSFRIACGLVLAAAGLAILPVSSGSATLIHVYDLNGSLADGLGGPALLSDGGILGPTSYSFGPNQGLTLAGGLPNPGVYTIELTCRLSTVTGYRKLIDYENLTLDAGLYTLTGTLNFYPIATSTIVRILPDQMACITLTRDASGVLTGYVDAFQIWSVADPSNLGVVGPAANVLRFFEDDFVTSQLEASAGVVDRIRVWDGPLTASEVADACFGVTPTHQRTWGALKQLYR